MSSCTWIVVIMLCWSYSFLYDFHMMLFMLIWTYVDNIYADLTLWWCWSYVEYGLVLSDAMSIDLYLFLMCIKTFQSDLAWFWTMLSFLSWLQWFYLYMFLFFLQVVVLTHILSLFPNNVGINVSCKNTWTLSQVLVSSLVQGWCQMLYLSSDVILLKTFIYFL